jgi:hypothetical protein
MTAAVSRSRRFATLAHVHRDGGMAGIHLPWAPEPVFPETVVPDTPESRVLLAVLEDVWGE